MEFTQVLLGSMIPIVRNRNMAPVLRIAETLETAEEYAPQDNVTAVVSVGAQSSVW